jgi:hypothetical protein
MGVEDLIGAPVSAEGGFFDPLGLSVGKDDATLAWYYCTSVSSSDFRLLSIFLEHHQV